jgi:hypothetical protein
MKKSDCSSFSAGNRPTPSHPGAGINQARYPQPSLWVSKLCLSDKHTLCFSVACACKCHNRIAKTPAKKNV